MTRGDVVIVAVAGDFGKPRPAIIVQTDALPAEHGSVIVCQMTSKLTDAPHFRVTIQPSRRNGLGAPSQVMTDKLVAVKRQRIAQKIGRLENDEMMRINTALAFVLGLTD